MTDRELQESILKALDWEPDMETARIGVAVEDGVVTLFGAVATAAEKAAAETVALGMFGVTGVTNALDVDRADVDPADAVRAGAPVRAAARPR